MKTFYLQSVPMIKFKFYIKTNNNFSNTDSGKNYSAANQLPDKSSTKIILIIFGVFCFVGIAAFLGFFSIAFNGINSIMETNDKRNEQWKTVNSFPILKCRIYSDTMIKAPLSGNNAAFYLIKVGNEIYHRYNSSRSYMETYKHKQVQENFDFSMIAGYPKETKLSINGKLYSIDFKQAIMDTLGNGELYFTEKIVSRNPSKNHIHTDFSYDAYQTAENLKNKHPWINSYLQYQQGYSNIILKEYVFKDGDSVYIKGKIVNGKIVVFNEHQYASPLVN